MGLELGAGGRRGVNGEGGGEELFGALGVGRRGRGGTPTGFLGGLRGVDDREVALVGDWGVSRGGGECLGQAFPVGPGRRELPLGR